MNKSVFLILAFFCVILSAGCRRRLVDLQIIGWEMSEQEKGRSGGSGVRVHCRLVNESEHIAIRITHELVVEIRHSQPYPRSRQQTYKVTCGRRETSLLNPHEEREYENFIEIPFGDEVLGVSGRVLNAELITDFLPQRRQELLKTLAH